ncbi:branched-chain amino acid ABC transporter permease [Haloferax sp. ATB1]|uniref:branched-chain amino acid ABC transporter permease n=1 Tax=Haloferax sp. ATB1 TaxID=1508454 RepID=UPI0005B20599|nr:branched-chain amino acid ABC transporter permease [Haloferax sp. ATB1]
MSEKDANPSAKDALVGGTLFGRWEKLRGREGTVVGITAILVAVFPYLFARAPVVSGFLQGYQSLATLILIWGIFAIGFDLLLGYTGLLSFGHAAFWGGAAYAAGIVAKNVSGDPIVMVVSGTLFAVLLAWVLGFLSLRRGGIYFSILTLAFAQMFYYMAASPLAFLTNGENGLTGVEVGSFLGVIHLEADIPSVGGMLLGTWLYAFVGVFFVGAVAVAYRILNSPYGMVFRAIRENEQRAEFVGLNVWRYKLMAFIISGGFAGVAGSLFTIHGAYVPLQSLFWTESGDIVVMTVLGGAGSMFGPVLGVGLYLYIENIVSTIQALTIPFTGIVLVRDFGFYWHLLLGVVFVVVVWVVPDGLWGILNRLRELTVDLGSKAAKRLRARSENGGGGQ